MNIIRRIRKAVDSDKAVLMKINGKEKGLELPPKKRKVYRPKEVTT